MLPSQRLAYRDIALLEIDAMRDGAARGEAQAEISLRAAEIEDAQRPAELLRQRVMDLDDVLKPVLGGPGDSLREFGMTVDRLIHFRQRSDQPVEIRTHR